MVRRLAALTAGTATNVDCDTDVTTGLSADRTLVRRDPEPADDLGFDRPVSPDAGAPPQGPPVAAAAEARAVVPPLSPPGPASATRVERFPNAAEDPVSIPPSALIDEDEDEDEHEAAARSAAPGPINKARAADDAATRALPRKRLGERDASLPGAAIGPRPAPGPMRHVITGPLLPEPPMPPRPGLSRVATPLQPEASTALRRRLVTPSIGDLALAMGVAPAPRPTPLPVLSVAPAPMDPAPIDPALLAWPVRTAGDDRLITGPVPAASWAPPPRAKPSPLRKMGTGPLASLHELVGAEAELSDTVNLGPPESTSFIARYPWLLLVMAVVISASMITMALVKRARLAAGPQVWQSSTLGPQATAAPLVDPPADAGAPRVVLTPDAAQPAATQPAAAAPPARRDDEPSAAAGGDPDASLLRRARALLDGGDDGAAHALFAALVAGAQETLGGYARSAAALGDGKALARFEALLAEHEDLRRALRVRLLMAHRRWRQAAAAYRNLPAALRQQLGLQLWLAEIHTQRGQLHSARRLYAKLLAAPELGHPRLRLEALLGYSDVLLGLRRHAAALDQAQLAAQLVAAMPDEASVLVSPALRERIAHQLRCADVAVSRATRAR